MGKEKASNVAEAEPLQGGDPTQNGDVRNRTALKKELGLIDGVGIIIGIIIGSGIFISPVGVLQHSGSVGMSLVIWAASGVISMVGALCYAELGTSIPKSGGDYAYIYEAFGAFPAFLFLWTANCVFVPCTNAVMALTFSSYVLQPVFGHCVVPILAVKLLAGALISLLTLVNMYNIRWATKLQDTLMIFKILALVVIVAVGIVYLALGHTENLQRPFANTKQDTGSIALALYSGMFSYAGWNYLNYVTEELKSPYKNLPRAIWLSLPVVTVIYVCTNLAYFVSMPTADMLSSPAVAVTFGEKLLGPVAWIMPLFVAASTFGGLSVHIFTSARMCYVGARQGQLPGFLALIKLKAYTPAPALIFMCGLSLVMLLVDDIFMLINYAEFAESLFIGISTAGLLYLRWSRPEMHRPIKVSIAIPIAFFLMCLFLVMVPLFVHTEEVFVSLMIILLGIPVYLVGIQWSAKPKCLLQLSRWFTILVQKAALAMPEETHVGDH